VTNYYRVTRWTVQFIVAVPENNSAKRIPPNCRDVSRVYDLLSPEKFSQLLYFLPNLRRDLLVIRRARLRVHRIDHELPALFVHKRVNPIDEHVIPEDGQYVVPEFSFLFWEEHI